MSEPPSHLPPHPITIGLEISYQDEQVAFYKPCARSMNIPGIPQLWRHLADCMTSSVRTQGVHELRDETLPILALIAKQHDVIVGIMEEDGFTPIDPV